MGRLMARAGRRLMFKSPWTAYAAGVALVVAGAWCFHDGFDRRGVRPPWLVKTVTPGM